MLYFLNQALNYLTSLGGRANPELNLFFRYSVGGGTAAAADILVVWLLVEHGRFHPLVAGACSLALGIIINFSIVRYWSFKSTEPLVKQFASFLTVALAGAAINYVSYALMVGVFKWWYLLARAIAIVLAWAWNYAMNRAVTFRDIPYVR